MAKRQKTEYESSLEATDALLAQALPENAIGAAHPLPIPGTVPEDSLPAWWEETVHVTITVPLVHRRRATHTELGTAKYCQRHIDILLNGSDPATLQQIKLGCESEGCLLQANPSTRRIDNAGDALRYLLRLLETEYAKVAPAGNQTTGKD